MRKLLFITLAVLLSISIKAQITLEKTYPASASMTYLLNDGPKYYLYDTLSSNCELFNMDHTVWKTIALQIPADHYLYSIQYVSDEIFATDSQVELLYITYRYDETAYYYEYTTRVINESGELLIDIPGASYASVYETPDNKAHLLAYVYDYSIAQVPSETKVYLLPGSFSYGVNEGPQAGGVLRCFPNPAADYFVVALTPNKAQATSTIELHDAHGQLIGVYPVAAGSTQFRVPTRQLPHGLYIVSLKTADGILQTQKMMVQ